MKKQGKTLLCLMIAFAMLFMYIPFSMGAETEPTLDEIESIQPDETEQAQGEESEEETEEEESEKKEKGEALNTEAPLAAPTGGGGIVPFADLTVSTFGDLQTALTNPANGSIALGSDIHITSPLVINREVTIEGNGWKLTTDQSRHIQVSASGVLTLDNVIIDGENSAGGIVVNGGTVYMKSGSIKNHSIATGSGGGVLIDGGKFYLQGGKVENNYARFGGGISVTDGELVISGNGQITDNTAQRYGGGIYQTAGTIRMEGGSIDNNTAGYEGGGISSDGATIYLSGGTILLNSADEGGGVSVAGGTLTVTSNADINDNRAIAGNGGGVYAYSNAKVNINGGTIQANRATLGAGVYIHDFSCSLSVTDGTFLQNIASNAGGGIFVNSASALSLTGGIFKKNEAVSSGGGMVIYTFASVSVSGMEFIENKVDGTNGQGGGLFTNRPLSVSDTRFYKNSAWQGGGFSVVGSNHAVSITGTTFDTNDARDGGGAYLSSIVGTISGDNTFSNNTAINNGGGMYLTGSKVTLQDNSGDGTTFSDNTATANGGAIYAMTSELKLAGAELNDNGAGGTGGAIHIESYEKIEIENTDFMGNNADGQGGAIRSNMENGKTFTVTGGDFVGNTSSREGGAFAFIGQGSITMNGTVFTENEGTFGGALYSSYRGDLYLTDVDFYRNKATASHGGGIHTQNSNIDLNDGRFEENTALGSMGSGGGVDLRSGGNLTIDGTVFHKNGADTQGGAVGITGADASVENAVFTENYSYGSGGALAASLMSAVDIDNTDFMKNSSVNGGALSLSVNSPLDMVGSKLEGNEASYGGAIYSSFSSNISMVGTGVTSNIAKIHGGAIYVNSTGTNYLEDVNFKGNKAKENGGAIHLDDLSKISGKDLTFEGNSSQQSYSVEIQADKDMHDTNFTGQMTLDEPFDYAYNNDDIVYTAGRKFFTVIFADRGSEKLKLLGTKEGETITDPMLTLDPNIGKEFLGWKHPTQSPDRPWDFASDTVNGNITLNAMWDTLTYDVTFNANGGSPNPNPQVVDHNDLVGTPDPMPTLTGYTLTGWTKNGTPWNLATDLVVEDMELVAQWKINTYDVSFDAGGGTPNPNSQKIDHGNMVNPPSPMPTRTGYTFAGWAHNGTPWNLSSDQVEENMTLVAQWRINAYTVTFHGNGGNVSQPSATVNYNALVNQPNANRSGYTLVEWRLGSPNGTRWNFNSDRVTQDMSLYAVWRQNPTPISYYTVNFNSNGGSAVDPQTVAAGSTLTNPSPSRTGHTFAGWFSQLNGGREWNFALDRVNSNMTLYARWNPVPYNYTVTFDSNGAQQAARPAAMLVTAPATTISALPSVPVREGYIFEGWFTGRDTGSPFTVNTPVRRNLTVYARWRVQYYQLSFETNGANSPTPVGQSVAFGEQAQAVENPQKDGHTFLSWNTAEDGSGMTWSFASTTMPAQDVTLYAQWQLNLPDFASNLTQNRNDLSGNGNGNGGNNSPTFTIGDTQVPLYGFGGEYWSVLNLIFVIAGLIGSGIFILRRNKQNDLSQRNKKIASAIVAGAAVVLYLLTQNMGNVMALFDEWTIPMLLLLGVQIALWVKLPEGKQKQEPKQA